MIAELTDREQKCLAMPLGEKAPGRSLSKVTALSGTPGWIVTGNRIAEWRFDGFLEKDGTTYLCGPYVPGRSLESIVPLPLKEALPFVARLSAALALLSERQIPLFPLQTDSVWFCGDGGVLFFPPDVVREVRGLRTAEANLDAFEAVNHPDLKGEELASYSIAAIFYRVSTGSFPFAGSSAELIHEEARKRAILPPDKAVPGLSAELSELIMSGLGRGRDRIGLQVWKEKTEAWMGVELFTEPSAEEKARILREAAAERSRTNRRFKRSVFFEKNRIRIAIAAVIFVAVCVGAGYMIKNALAPRVTHGLSPADVVRLYYTSMNTFDHDTMSVCVIGKAGQEDITETMNVYILSRITLGYEGKSNIAGAAEWDKAGRPELPPTMGVYGVTGLAVTQEKGEPEPVLTARYVKWRPVSKDLPADPNAPSPPGPSFEGRTVTDRLTMAQDRGDWVIKKLERLTDEPL
jgi:hypothetical protein